MKKYGLVYVTFQDIFEEENLQPIKYISKYSKEDILGIYAVINSSHFFHFIYNWITYTNQLKVIKHFCDNDQDLCLKIFFKLESIYKKWEKKNFESSVVSRMSVLYGLDQIVSYKGFANETETINPIDLLKFHFSIQTILAKEQNKYVDDTKFGFIDYFPAVAYQNEYMSPFTPYLETVRGVKLVQYLLNDKTYSEITQKHFDDLGVKPESYFLFILTLVKHLSAPGNELALSIFSKKGN